MIEVNLKSIKKEFCKCGKSFIKVKYNKIFCSSICAAKYHNKNYGLRKIMIRDLAKSYAQGRVGWSKIVKLNPNKYEKRLIRITIDKLLQGNTRT